MIKKLLLIIASVLLFSSGVAYAVNSDLTKSASSSPDLIKQLKDKLASRVAELNVLSQKVFWGQVKTLSDQKIIMTAGSNEVNISLNDDTIYSQISSVFKKKTITLDTFKSGQSIFSWGTFNSSTNTLSARAIVINELPLYIVGKINSPDKKNFQFSLSSKDKNYLVDHQVTTSDFSYGLEKGLVKSGFSKFSEGQQVFVVGDLTTDKNGKELLSAQRIIILNLTK